MEILSERATKSLARLVYAAILAGVALFFAFLGLKLARPSSYFFQNDSIYIINTTLASCQIMALVLFSTYFMRRVLRSNWTGKRWSPRRLKGVQLSAIELSLQLFNSVLYLTPNARELAVTCSWFQPLVLWATFARLTIWNTLFLLFCIQAANMLLVGGRNGAHNASKERLVCFYGGKAKDI